ncbi:MAG TPA: sporulation protein YqfC [Clostridiaceae bacterium]|nr:sporulation protein YqfC [Clostridiaceae bacterium]
MSVSRKAGKKKEKKEEPKAGIREKLAEMLELPKEIVMNIPKMTMIGNKDLIIENYKGIIEYESNRIRINTGAGIIKITGDLMTIKEITSEDILVSGNISSLEFLK